MLSKKGMSEVVATVLLLLITISAVVLLSNFIVPFVKNNLYSSTECVSYQSYFKFQEKYTNGSGDYYYNCYQSSDAGKALIGFSVSAQTSDSNISSNLKGFQISFSNGLTTNSTQIDSSKFQNRMSEGETYLLDNLDPITAPNLIVPAEGETVTYVYNASQPYTSASIYPVLNSGRICEKSDTINLVPCNGVNLILPSSP